MPAGLCHSQQMTPCLCLMLGRGHSASLQAAHCTKPCKGHRACQSSPVMHAAYHFRVQGACCQSELYLPQYLHHAPCTMLPSVQAKVMLLQGSQQQHVRSPLSHQIPREMLDMSQHRNPCQLPTCALPTAITTPSAWHKLTKHAIHQHLIHHLMQLQALPSS